MGSCEATAAERGGHLGTPFLPCRAGAERAGPAQGCCQAKVDGSHCLDGRFLVVVAPS